MLITERLVLSQPSIADFPLFSRILSCPQQTRFLPNERPYNLVQRETYLKNRINHWHQHGFGIFVISLKDDFYQEAFDEGEDEAELEVLAQSGIKLGFIGIEYTPLGDYVDIRFALSKEYEGHGYTQEAGKAVLSFMAENTELTYVYGAAMLENLASKAVLVKLGMTPVTGVRLYDCDDLDYFSLALKALPLS